MVDLDPALAAATPPRLVGKWVLDLDDPDTETAHYRGRDRVADRAIARADRDAADKKPSGRERRLGASPRASPTSALLDHGCEIKIPLRRRTGGRYAVVEDLNGTTHGVRQDMSHTWSCTCTPGRDNPGCRHQQAVQAANPRYR